MNDFSHIDNDGKPSMVNVSDKIVTQRMAAAQCTMFLPKEVTDKFASGDIQTKKGAVLQTAIVAGIMAAKKTGELIPLCHPLALEDCKIEIYFNLPEELVITCTATITAKTGVEMEALTGASIAALTVYDMCKALSHDIVIREIKLLRKTGGKHDYERA